MHRRNSCHGVRMSIISHKFSKYLIDHKWTSGVILFTISVAACRMKCWDILYQRDPHMMWLKYNDPSWVGMKIQCTTQTACLLQASYDSSTITVFFHQMTQPVLQKIRSDLQLLSIWRVPQCSHKSSFHRWTPGNWESVLNQGRAPSPQDILPLQIIFPGIWAIAGHWEGYLEICVRPRVGYNMKRVPKLA
jgi:hypothetical protein